MVVKTEVIVGSLVMSKVAILTNFAEFHPGYSLTGIVSDQARMLSRYGHEVYIYVTEHFSEKYPSPKDAVIEKKIPARDLRDYRSQNEISADHRVMSGQISTILQQDLVSFDFVFTHDWIFTGWNLPYALAIKDASQKLKQTNPKLRWLHWIHSVPSLRLDWWDIRSYGPMHRIVFPNKTDQIRVAEQYRALPNWVKVIPHIKDLRSWFDFHEETCRLIDDFPSIMQADVVQVYPASADRLHAKGVKEVICIFSELKKRGLSVSLLIADQWATGRQPRQNVEHYEEIARRNGLVVGKEFMFTSRWDYEKYGTGLPKRMLRELWQCSNLFIFPTKEESFGLVSPEAALSGGVLLVLNKSLLMQLEVNGFTGLYLDFGSYHNMFKPANERQYFRDVATLIINQMRNDSSIMSKTFMRKQYNWDNIYLKYYEPIMIEARNTWM